MTTSNTKRPLTKTILYFLASIGEAGLDYYNMFAAPRRFGWQAVGQDRYYVRELSRLRDKAVAQRALKNLRKSKYIIAQKIGKKVMIKLTSKGLKTTLTNQLRQAPKRSDGLATVVIFDIPEDFRAVRRELRWFLRQGGFHKLQQSVWLHEGDVYKLVNNFIKETKAERWINVFYGSNFLRS